MVKAQPIGAWSLRQDALDSTSAGLHGLVQGKVDFTGEYAHFDGNGFIELPDAVTRVVEGSFTLSAWVRLSNPRPGVIGDICGSVVPDEISPVTLGFQHGTSTGNQRNTGNLFFGLDDGSEPVWTDHGHIGDAYFVGALAVHAGNLFAGTYEGSPDHLGRVYQFDGTTWADCGFPGTANSVTALASHNGCLFAGTTRYKAGGSGLADSPNTEPGGEIYRFDSASREWTQCGRLGDGDSVGGFAVLAGILYAIPAYTPGLFIYDDEGDWTEVPGPGRRLLALGTFKGSLFGAGNDHVNVEDAIDKTRKGVVVEAVAKDVGGGVFRFAPESRTWTQCGLQPQTTQVYSIAVHQDDMYVGTWPNGIVFRYAGGSDWEHRGRLASEQEVMGMVSFNGTLYAGSVPAAAIFRLRGQAWERVGVLEPDTDILYPRAASLAVFNGELFCGTSPSGKVWSMSVGVGLSLNTEFPVDWTHIAAVRGADSTRLYVNGRLEAEAQGSTTAGLPAAEFRIGSGAHAHFTGDLADVRMFDSALSSREIEALAVKE